MAENSAIEWTHHTFNPWWGCQKVSPACDHCYAERDAKRFAAGQVLWGVGSERRTFADKHWKAPTDWNTKARESREQLGYLHERPRVFCASMGDWLDLDAPIGEFVRLLRLIEHTPELDWLLLTKRIGNWSKRLQEAVDRVDASMSFVPRWAEDWLNGKPPANAWIGSTVVNQEEADRDIPKLLQVPARVRFLSMEPLLGPVRIFDGTGDPHPVQTQRGIVYPPGALSWVIVGGESGPGARPMHPDWARSLRDQCKAAGVPFLFKQWGEWAPTGPLTSPDCAVDRQARTVQPMMRGEFPKGATSADGWQRMYRVGKKVAGRLLDGVQHDGYPA